MNKHVISLVLVCIINYAFILTAWSMLLPFARENNIESFFGFGIIAIIYFYLQYVLKRINKFEVRKNFLILYGTLIIFSGCVISTTGLWFYNSHLGYTNNITKSIRASIFNALLGFVISLVLSNKLKTEAQAE